MKSYNFSEITLFSLVRVTSIFVLIVSYTLTWFNLAMGKITFGFSMLFPLFFVVGFALVSIAAAYGSEALAVSIERYSYNRRAARLQVTAPAVVEAVEVIKEEEAPAAPAVVIIPSEYAEENEGVRAYLEEVLESENIYDLFDTDTNIIKVEGCTTSFVDFEYNGVKYVVFLNDHYFTDEKVIELLTAYYYNDRCFEHTPVACIADLENNSIAYRGMSGYVYNICTYRPKNA